MNRHLFLPAVASALAAALLGGCVSDYQYRGGTGDYYYGQPGVEYRDYGYGYGDPYGVYGYPGGWSGSIGYGAGYGGGPYGYGGYGYPYGYGGYGGYPNWRPPVIVVRPGPRGGHRHHPGNDHDNDADDTPSSVSRPAPTGFRGTLPAGPLPSTDSPRLMLPGPSLRQDRAGEPRVQQEMRRRAPRERDDGLTPRP